MPRGHTSVILDPRALLFCACLRATSSKTKDMESRMRECRLLSEKLNIKRYRLLMHAFQGTITLKLISVQPYNLLCACVEVLAKSGRCVLWLVVYVLVVFANSFEKSCRFSAESIYQPSSFFHRSTA